MIQTVELSPKHSVHQLVEVLAAGIVLARLKQRRPALILVRIHVVRIGTRERFAQEIVQRGIVVVVGLHAAGGTIRRADVHRFLGYR